MSIITEKIENEKIYFEEKLLKHSKRKYYTNLISTKYLQIEENKKANNLKMCNSYLIFDNLEHKETKEIKKEYQTTLTCKDRFCASCNYIKQRKKIKEMAPVIETIKNNNLKPLLLTLTIKNCKVEDLRETITKMNKAWRYMITKLVDYKQFKGYYKSLEVTYNKKTKELHPHFHILLLVEENYFKKTNKKYLTKDKIIQDWADALKVNYKPNIDIRIIKDKDNFKNSAIYEIIKYATKHEDILEMDNDIFKKFLEQIKNIRNYEVGGIIKQNLKEIKNDKEIFNELLSDENILKDFYLYLSSELYLFRQDRYKLSKTYNKHIESV